MSSDVETPTTEAIADALDVEADTVRECLETDLKLTLAHLIAFTDLDENEIDDELEQEIELWFDEFAWREFIDRRSHSGYLIDTCEYRERLQLLRCPICGAEWLPTWAKATNDPLARHLQEEHGPDDLVGES